MTIRTISVDSNPEAREQRTCKNKIGISYPASYLVRSFLSSYIFFGIDSNQILALPWAIQGGVYHTFYLVKCFFLDYIIPSLISWTIINTELGFPSSQNMHSYSVYFSWWPDLGKRLNLNMVSSIFRHCLLDTLLSISLSRKNQNTTTMKVYIDIRCILILENFKLKIFFLNKGIQSLLLINLDYLCNIRGLMGYFFLLFSFLVPLFPYYMNHFYL